MSNYNFIKNQNIAQATTVSDKFVQVQEQDGSLVLKNADYYSYGGDKKVIAQISPQTQVPSNLANAQIDIKIENILDVLDFPVIQWTYVNNTGANASVVCAPLHFQRIDVTSNGSNVLFQTYDQELFMSNFWLDRTTYEALASTEGLTNAYANTATVVSNGGSITMNCPLFGFFKAAKLAPYALPVPLLLRLYFNSSALINLTGAPMTCQNLKLICHGKMLKSGPKGELMSVYKNMRIPLALSHLSVDRQSSTQQLGPSQNVKLILTGITGVVAYLVMTIRLATDSAVSTGLVNYIRMDSFDVLDSQGASLNGFYNRDVQTQQISWAQNFGNNAWTNSNFAISCWSADPRNAFACGQNSGYCIMSGNEYISFNTPSTLASNSYIIDIRAWVHESIIIDAKNNTMKTTRI